jgi:hypothetical protein
MPYDAQKALNFAQAKSGRYRDGECWTLVEDAVVGAGGVSSTKLTPNFSPAASFVWGTPVQASQLKPGDVLQFTGYDWTRTVVTDVTMPPNHEKGGDVSTAIEGGKRGEPQHSAIVVNVISPGVVDVIEQNIPATSGPVQTIRLVLIARPKTETTTRETIRYKDAGDPDGQRELTGDVITKVTITETVLHPPKCYRPK